MSESDSSDSSMNELDETVNVGESSANPLNLETENSIESPAEVDKNKKRDRSLTSNVWDYFKTIGKGADGKNRAECLACGKQYVCGGHDYGTSSLRRHKNACQMIPKFHETTAGKLMLHQGAKLRTRKVDNKVVRDMLAMSIIEHDLAFNFVEYRRIRELLKYLNPEVKVPSRRASTIDIIKLYEGEKKKLKEELAKVPSRINLTSDLWTACTAAGYISLTAHYVDENWKLNSKILNFCHCPPPHSGQELAKIVNDFLVDWGIEGKIFSLTLDNAKSNDTLEKSLRDTLKNNKSLLCDGEFFHVRCCAHILNLIVQDGLDVANDALSKIRESVKYVRATQGRRDVFKVYVEKHGIDKETKVGLRLDVVTRWNSTYLMLKSALVYRRAFKELALDDSHYKSLPSDEDWERGKKICEVLLPFYDITNMFSGSTYPTSNLYFMQVWIIECLLFQNKTHEDAVIRDMIKEMQLKFDKYWCDYSVILALASVLDPRLKLQFLEFCYSDIGLDAIARQTKMRIVKQKMYDLFHEYVNNFDGGSQSTQETLDTTSDIANASQPSSSLTTNVLDVKIYHI
ncbi:zinc finger BED domain-containing protein RICESLEEPER 2-like [Lotus japonicus]|uniref:zinc finger BED domain-containing protein RICESLEEPER 2-like n=1 Tax=Lotus japonicus TaxID=34305 RepID=UPI00258572E0|nr:zinc finger BED domain-containing protein RICESLEEPER 2-like [Lotus japonicus]